MRPKKNTPGEAAVASARPATSPEAQEQYMINLTMQLVERRLREGTASSAETTHFLKLATMKADLERKTGRRKQTAPGKDRDTRKRKGHQRNVRKCAESHGKVQWRGRRRGPRL